MRVLRIRCAAGLPSRSRSATAIYATWALLFAALPCCDALPATNLHVRYSEEGGRLPSGDGLPQAVEKPATNPAEMLDCLKRHRYTPLACQMLNQTEYIADAPRSPPPPPASECGPGTEANSVCYYGRGHCQYDALRGWYCRCGVPRAVARGVRRATYAVALAPHCIEE